MSKKVFLCFLSVFLIMSVSHLPIEASSTGSQANILNKRLNSTVDWLKFLSLKNKVIRVSVLGSSVTEGIGASEQNKHWSTLLNGDLTRIPRVTNLKLINNGYGGATTSSLIKENRVDEVIKNKPHIIIFEVTLINNFYHNISIDQTKKDIEEIINTIQKGSPRSLIVLQSGNPISWVHLNQLNLTYADYNREIGKFIVDNKWNFIDVYSEYDNYVKTRHLGYKDYLNDDVHPNDEGYRIWYEILRKKLGDTPVIK